MHVREIRNELTSELVGLFKLGHKDNGGEELGQIWKAGAVIGV